MSETDRIASLEQKVKQMMDLLYIPKYKTTTNVTDLASEHKSVPLTSPPDYKLEIEEFAEQLHIWYLEATTSIGDVNPNAQRPYADLSDDQRDIDRYIATKLTHLIETEKKKADSMNEIANMVARHKEVDFVFNGKTYHIKELQGEVEW